jgi:hypothetical protein
MTFCAQQWLLRGDSNPSFKMGGLAGVDGNSGEGEPFDCLRVATARRSLGMSPCSGCCTTTFSE